MQGDEEQVVQRPTGSRIAVAASQCLQTRGGVSMIAAVAAVAAVACCAVRLSSLPHKGCQTCTDVGRRRTLPHLAPCRRRDPFFFRVKTESLPLPRSCFNNKSEFGIDVSVAVSDGATPAATVQLSSSCV